MTIPRVKQANRLNNRYGEKSPLLPMGGTQRQILLSGGRTIGRRNTRILGRRGTIMPQNGKVRLFRDHHGIGQSASALRIRKNIPAGKKTNGAQKKNTDPASHAFIIAKAHP